MTKGCVIPSMIENYIEWSDIENIAEKLDRSQQA